MPSPPDHCTNELDLTKGNPLQTRTVEELKVKLGCKEIVEEVVKQVGEEGMIPENHGDSMTTKHLAYNTGAHPALSEDGLIIARKPPNPYLESQDRQSLHKELLFNQKIGKNVLNQKSELQKALEKHKDAQAKKELEQQISQTVPEFEKVVAERAKRLQTGPIQNEEEDKGLNKQFLEARAKLRTRTDSK